MDVEKTLRELYSEKRVLDSVISRLERRLQQDVRKVGGKRRGRKTMGAAERQAVSKRMTRYWEARRAQALALASAAAAGSPD